MILMIVTKIIIFENFNGNVRGKKFYAWIH